VLRQDSLEVIGNEVGRRLQQLHDQRLLALSAGPADGECDHLRRGDPGQPVDDVEVVAVAAGVSNLDGAALLGCTAGDGPEGHRERIAQQSLRCRAPGRPELQGVTVGGVAQDGAVLGDGGLGECAGELFFTVMGACVHRQSPVVPGESERDVAYLIGRLLTCLSRVSAEGRPPPSGGDTELVGPSEPGAPG